MSTASCLPAERPWRGKVVVELIKGDGPLADLAIGLASDLGGPETRAGDSSISVAGGTTFRHR